MRRGKSPSPANPDPGLSRTGADVRPNLRTPQSRAGAQQRAATRTRCFSRAHQSEIVTVRIRALWLRGSSRSRGLRVTPRGGSMAAPQRSWASSRVALCWNCDRNLGAAREPANDAVGSSTPTSWRSGGVKGSVKRLIPDRALPWDGAGTLSRQPRLSLVTHLDHVACAADVTGRRLRGRHHDPQP
jgi:hypothetical protein